MVNGYPWGANAFPQAEWRQGIGEILGEGVVADRTGTALVTATGADMEVDIRAHRAMVQGVQDDFAATSLDVSAVGSNPTSGQSRIDYVCWKYDPTAKTLTLVVVAGSPATTGSAVAPSLTRSTSGVWHVPIARVTRTGTAAVQSAGVVNCHAWLGPHYGTFPFASLLPADAPQGSTAWVGDDLWRRYWSGSMQWRNVGNPEFSDLSAAVAASGSGKYRVIDGRIEFSGQRTRINYPTNTDPVNISTGSFDLIGALPSGARPSIQRHTTCRLLNASYGGGMLQVDTDGLVYVRAPAGASATTVSLDGCSVAL